MARILAFAGSLRKESFNKKLVKVAAHGARKAGAEVTYIDLADYPLPLFDEDWEAQNGLHPNARKLKDLFLSHHGLLVSAPEYNSSMSAVLKNALDWVSRPVPTEKPYAPFSGKAIALVSASPGNFGGIRGLVPLRLLVTNLTFTLLPDTFSLAKADTAFDSSGNLHDAASQARAEAVGAALATMLSRLGY